MDGGVAAALIEKEALSGASLAAHFRDKRDMERARAVKAEQERDEALYQRDQWMRGSDSWRATLDEAIEERRRIARALDLSEAVSADRMVERIEEVNGEGRTVTDEMVVRHKCDNPPCVNPDHLEVGTHQDNVDDMIARGRAAWQKAG